MIPEGLFYFPGVAPAHKPYLRVTGCQNKLEPGLELVRERNQSIPFSRPLDFDVGRNVRLTSEPIHGSVAYEDVHGQLREVGDHAVSTCLGHWLPIQCRVVGRASPGLWVAEDRKPNLHLCVWAETYDHKKGARPHKSEPHNQQAKRVNVVSILLSLQFPFWSSQNFNLHGFGLDEIRITTACDLRAAVSEIFLSGKQTDLRGHVGTVIFAELV